MSAVGVGSSRRYLHQDTGLHLRDPASIGMKGSCLHDVAPLILHSEKDIDVQTVQLCWILALLARVGEGLFSGAVPN